jgi:N-acetylglucosaminyldiphosphoundecaprenol N-acetyl-beta-D-mannosaminyltransferase
VSDLAPTKRNLLGILVDATSYEDVVERVFEAARTATGLAVSATAVHGVMEGVHDAEHAARLNAFDILTPDGQPVRWALNWLHRTKLRDRVYGPELMLRCCERAAREGFPIYLYGSTAGTLRPLAERLEQRFPGLVVAGTSESRFSSISADAQEEVAAQIRASGARLVFVGLGCPRQEIFCHAMRDQVSLPLLAVGAAFDFHAGLAREAPAWMQRSGLQWLHRLAGNPRRLWRRYLLLNPEYAWRVLIQRLRGAPEPAPPAPAPPAAAITAAVPG